MGGFSLDEFLSNYKNLWAQYARRVNTDYATVLCPGEHTIFIILWVFIIFFNRYLNCDPRFILRMLETFFKFVLLDPNVTVNWFTRQQLLTTLLQTASALLQCTGMSKF